MVKTRKNHKTFDTILKKEEREVQRRDQKVQKSHKKGNFFKCFLYFFNEGWCIIEYYDDFWFIAVVVGKSSMYSALYYPIIFLFGKV